MPFKLRLKKSRRHYDVVSKKVFVVSVELLDKAVVECSLSSDSNGQELFDNVCQRIGLHQTEFFGLRFASSKWRRRSPRWLDLDKPVKRQLERYGDDPPSTQLSLGVLYYVGDVALLFDEVARYHYFLQLKSDIVDGNISCNADEAVILAGYCLQAEFGNHDPLRHTFEYLKDFPLLPKNLCLDAPNLLAQVIATHAKMVGLVPAAAEQNYIGSVQQLDDYGVEYFPAKDERGEEALIGVSIAGVVHKSPLSGKSVLFNWSSILNLSNQKRRIVVECEKSEAVSSRLNRFRLEDSDTAKYVWRLCILQHKFYMKTRSAVRFEGASTAPDPANWRSVSMPNLQSHMGYETGSASAGSRGTSYVFHGHHLHGDPRVEYLALSSGAISELTYEMDPRQLHRQLQHQQQHFLEEPDIEEEVVDDENTATADPRSAVFRSIGLSAVDVHRNGSCSTFDVSSSSSPPAPAVAVSIAASASTLDTVDDIHGHLHHWNLQQQQQQQQQNRLAAAVASSSSSLASTRALVLPTYRPAPDYDTAVSKYGGTSRSGELSALMPASNGGIGVHNHLMADGFPVYNDFVGGSAEILSTSSQSQSPSHRVVVVGEEGERPTITSSTYDLLVHELSRLRPPPPYPYGAGGGCGGGVGEKQSINTPERLSIPHLYDVAEAMSRSEVAIGGSGSDDQNSVVAQDKRGSEGVIAAELVRRTSKSPASSLESKRSRVKDVRCRSSSTQSAPDPTIFIAAAAIASNRGVISSSSSRSTADDARCTAFERKLSEGSVFAEFSAIPRRRLIQGPSDVDCATALMPENASRNRYAVLPYDDNRVQLTPTIDNPKGYINASHMLVDVGGLERLSYVAAQGPLPNTAADFWRMVWQLDARVVVMLTDVTDERGTEKCFQYWPQESQHVIGDGSGDGHGGGNECLHFDHLQVVRRFGIKSASFVTDSLLLTHASFPKRTRNVWHIRYVDWPDHGCPEITGFLSFINEIESVRRHDDIGSGRGVVGGNDSRLRRSSESPTIIHCSAGVGRTGVTILCDVMIHALDRNLDLDVPKVLALLRHQRMLIVQTLAQYKFVYAVLVQYLKNSRLI